MQFCFVTAYAATCDSVNIDDVKQYHDSDEKRASKRYMSVILDVDETALDNSWLEYDNYKDYSEEEFRKD